MFLKVAGKCLPPFFIRLNQLSKFKYLLSKSIIHLKQTTKSKTTALVDYVVFIDEQRLHITYTLN